MIKIVASVQLLKDGNIKTCSMQRKQNKKLTIQDIDRIIKFVKHWTGLYYKVSVWWKISYDEGSKLVSGISSREYFINSKTTNERFIRLLDTINKYIQRY